MRNIYYWECINNRKGRCRGRLKTIGDKLYIANSNGKRTIKSGTFSPDINCINSLTFSVPHNHDSEDYRIDEARGKGALMLKSLNEASREYDEKSSIKVEMVQDESI